MNFNDYPYRGQYGFPDNWPNDWPFWENLICYPCSTTAGTSLTYSGLIVPPDVHHVLALVWGGGGSGAGSPGSQDGSSTGGGGGGFSAGIIDCWPGQQLPDVVIGGTTNGTSGAVGTTGSTSSIGNLLISTGGLGGVNAATSTAAVGPSGGTGTANLRIGFTAIGGYGGSTSGLGATSRRATGGGGPGWFWTSNLDGRRNRGGDTTAAHANACATGGGGLGGRGGDSAQILTANQITRGGGLGGNAADHALTTGNLNGSGGSLGDASNSNPTAGPGFFMAAPASTFSAITTNSTIAVMDRYEVMNTFRELINMFAFGGNTRSVALKIREFHIGGFGIGTLNSAGTINHTAAGLGGGGASFGGAQGVAANSAGAVNGDSADFFGGGGGAANVGAGACTGGNGGVAGGGGGARNGSSGAACTGGQGGGGFAILAWTRGY